MDKSISANTTITKLIEARKRGVHTVLFVDDLQQWMEPELLQAYKMAGGVFESLNPQWKLSSLQQFKDKEIFRRHHEKIFVSDNIGIIGSSNIESGYACIWVLIQRLSSGLGCSKTSTFTLKT